MTRLELIKQRWKNLLSKRYKLRGWPQPPEHWLDLNRDGWYESILDIGERCLREVREKELPSVKKELHDDEVIRREIHFQGADSMLMRTGIHGHHINRSQKGKE